MAGDVGIRERVVILPDTRAFGAAPALETNASRRVVHVYGNRVVVVEDSGAPAPGLAESMPGSRAVVQTLSEDERLGYDAYLLRESPDYQSAKEARPRDGESWDAGEGMSCMPPEGQQEYGETTAQAGAPTRQRLTASDADGIFILEG